MDPGRIVFAGRTKLSEHLARHALSDLFLDTSPCNAHTTASDALWAGIPVLTMPGSTFASRVAASLVKAAGVPDLVVASAHEYEETAVALANAPEKIADLKRRLQASRESCLLFDTARTTRRIENAFAEMVRRHHAKIPLEPFVV